MSRFEQSVRLRFSRDERRMLERLAAAENVTVEALIRGQLGLPSEPRPNPQPINHLRVVKPSTAQKP
jgi:hypothetical protein